MASFPAPIQGSINPLVNAVAPIWANKVRYYLNGVDQSLSIPPFVSPSGVLFISLRAKIEIRAAWQMLVSGPNMSFGLQGTAINPPSKPVVRVRNVNDELNDFAFTALPFPTEKDAISLLINPTSKSMTVTVGYSSQTLTYSTDIKSTDITEFGKSVASIGAHDFTLGPIWNMGLEAPYTIQNTNVTQGNKVDLYGVHGPILIGDGSSYEVEFDFVAVVDGGQNNILSGDDNSGDDYFVVDIAATGVFRVWKRTDGVTSATIAAPATMINGRHYRGKFTVSSGGVVSLYVNDVFQASSTFTFNKSERLSLLYSRNGGGVPYAGPVSRLTVKRNGVLIRNWKLDETGNVAYSNTVDRFGPDQWLLGQQTLPRDANTANSINQVVGKAYQYLGIPTGVHYNDGTGWYAVPSDGIIIAKVTNTLFRNVLAANPVTFTPVIREVYELSGVGPELVSGFTTGGWEQQGGGTITDVGESTFNASLSGTGLKRTGLLAVGRVYEIQLAGKVNCDLWIGLSGATAQKIDANGTFYIIPATGSTELYVRALAAGAVGYSSLSVREVPHILWKNKTAAANKLMANVNRLYRGTRDTDGIIPDSRNADGANLWLHSSANVPEGWTYNGDGSYTCDGSQAANIAITVSTGLVAADHCLVEYTVDPGAVGKTVAFVGTGSGGGENTGPGTYRKVIKRGASGTLFLFAIVGFSGTIRDISFKKTTAANVNGFTEGMVQ